jgi:hypothetical protein
MVEDSIVIEKKIDEMHVSSEGRPSNVTNKHFKEDKKEYINIMKEEDGILVNIHGTRHHQSTLQQAIIRDQQSLQIGESSTKIHTMR